MTRTSTRPAFAVPLLLLTVILLMPASEAAGTQHRVLKDREKDVMEDTEKMSLDRLVDLTDFEGEKKDDFEERPSIDIESVTISENDTYVSYAISLHGEIRDSPEFTYIIAGYDRKDPRTIDPYDFIIEFNGGNATYSVWTEGSYTNGGNVSMVSYLDNEVNITMNRARFVLGSRSDPYLVAFICVFDQGLGKARYIDFLISERIDDDGGSVLDSTTSLVIQLVLIGFAFLAMLFLWNFWARKKGLEKGGGVCPKCESRLDGSLDFCPSCGTFIRGPQAKSVKEPVQTPRKIVEKDNEE